MFTELCLYSFHRLIFFGGYGYTAQGTHQGTFEYDESSSLVVCNQDKSCFFSQCLFLFSFSLNISIS